MSFAKWDHFVSPHCVKYDHDFIHYEDTVSYV